MKRPAKLIFILRACNCVDNEHPLGIRTTQYGQILEEPNISPFFHMNTETICPNGEWALADIVERKM